MGNFKTLDLSVNHKAFGNYQVRGMNTAQRVDVVGEWRSRPKGRRLFSAEQIRVIRSNRSNGFTLEELAVAFDCSRVSIYHIVNRSIYRDVN